MDRRVCCGDYVPEGRQVCLKCSRYGLNTKHNMPKLNRLKAILGKLRTRQ